MHMLNYGNIMVQDYADKIYEQLISHKFDSLPVFGGRVSSELMIPKIIETLEEDKEIYDYAREFAETGDLFGWYVDNQVSYSYYREAKNKIISIYYY